MRVKAQAPALFAIGGKATGDGTIISHSDSAGIILTVGLLVVPSWSTLI